MSRTSSSSSSGGNILLCGHGYGQRRSGLASGDVGDAGNGARSPGTSAVVVTNHNVGENTAPCVSSNPAPQQQPRDLSSSSTCAAVSGSAAACPSPKTTTRPSPAMGYAALPRFSTAAGAAMADKCCAPESLRSGGGDMVQTERRSVSAPNLMGLGVTGLGGSPGGWGGRLGGVHDVKQSLSHSAGPQMGGNRGTCFEVSSATSEESSDLVGSRICVPGEMVEVRYDNYGPLRETNDEAEQEGVDGGRQRDAGDERWRIQTPTAAPTTAPGPSITSSAKQLLQQKLLSSGGNEVVDQQQQQQRAHVSPEGSAALQATSGDTSFDDVTAAAAVPTAQTAAASSPTASQHSSALAMTENSSTALQTSTNPDVKPYPHETNSNMTGLAGPLAGAAAEAGLGKAGAEAESAKDNQLHSQTQHHVPATKSPEVAQTHGAAVATSQRVTEGDSILKIMVHRVRSAGSTSTVGSGGGSGGGGDGESGARGSTGASDSTCSNRGSNSGDVGAGAWRTIGSSNNLEVTTPGSSDLDPNCIKIDRDGDGDDSCPATQQVNKVVERLVQRKKKLQQEQQVAAEVGGGGRRGCGTRGRVEKGEGEEQGGT